MNNPPSGLAAFTSASNRSVSLGSLSVRPQILKLASPSSRAHIHTGLIFPSHPGGRFQQVIRQSCRKTTPRLLSGCKQQMRGVRPKWGRFVKYWTQHNPKTCSIMSWGRWARNYAFLSLVPPQTKPFTRPTVTLNGFLFLQMLLCPEWAERQLGVAFRSIRGQMQRAKITALLTEKSCSPLCGIVLRLNQSQHYWREVVWKETENGDEEGESDSGVLLLGREKRQTSAAVCWKFSHKNSSSFGVRWKTLRLFCCCWKWGFNPKVPRFLKHLQRVTEVTDLQ